VPSVGARRSVASEGGKGIDGDGLADSLGSLRSETVGIWGRGGSNQSGGWLRVWGRTVGHGVVGVGQTSRSSSSLVSHHTVNHTRLTAQISFLPSTDYSTTTTEWGVYHIVSGRKKLVVMNVLELFQSILKKRDAKKHRCEQDIVYMVFCGKVSMR
jgi:hypothetical protein